MSSWHPYLGVFRGCAAIFYFLFFKSALVVTKRISVAGAEALGDFLKAWGAGADLSLFYSISGQQTKQSDVLFGPN